MKGWQKAGWTAAAAVLAAGLVFGAGGLRNAWNTQTVEAAASTDTAADTHTITVSGHGEVKADPDVAYINLGIQSRADTAKAAQADNAKQFAAVKEALSSSFQVADKDLQTVQFNVNPEYKYPDNEAPQITGYVVTHTVQLTYRDLDNLGSLLDAVSSAGVNQVNSIQFGTEKPDTYEKEVLANAMADARAKAQAIAQSEGLNLQKVVQVVENGASAPVVQPISMMKMSTSSAAADSASTSIEAGQLTLSEDVTVAYTF